MEFGGIPKKTETTGAGRIGVTKLAEKHGPTSSKPSEVNKKKRRKISVEFEKSPCKEQLGNVRKHAFLGRGTDEKSINHFPSDDDDDLIFLAAENSFNQEKPIISINDLDSQDLRDETFCSCPSSPENPKSKIIDRFNRYTIGKMMSATGPGKVSKERIVAYHVRNEKTLRWSKLILRDSWTRMPPLNEGTVVNVIESYPDENGVLTVERGHGYLVVNPDRLVSVTSVVGQSWCDRKVAFSERFRFPADNLDTLKGVIAHELIGRAMSKRIQDIEELEKELMAFLRTPGILENAYGQELSQKELTNLCVPLMEYVLSFNRERVLHKSSEQKWTINRVKDIEDCFWNPEFGIKGKVDCTVEIRNEFHDLQIVPLEFKTGNPRFIGKSKVRSEHMGQVQLYTLLMRTFMPQSFHNPNGLLLYIMEKYLMECTASVRDLQGLINARNQVVFNTPINGSNGPFFSLPRPVGIDFDRNCKKCEYMNVCATYLRLNLEKEKISQESYTRTENSLVDSIAHLNVDERNFFEKWIKVVNLEADEDELTFDSKNLWLKSVAERERNGKCIGELKLLHQNEDKVLGLNLVSLLIPEQKRENASAIFEKDFIILGTCKEPCVSFGCVEGLKGGILTISTECPLGSRHVEPGTLFSVDKIFSSSPGMMQFVYMVNMMADTASAARIRSYIIEKKRPIFRALDKKELGDKEKRIISEYNVFQKQAIIKSLCTDSFLLVKGSPGCGKTTTIVGMIRVLVLQKKSVLVAAYTSNAVDNILLSYGKYSKDFIRIGSGKLKNKLLTERSSAVLRQSAKTVEDLSGIYDNVPVVATTLLSLKHPIFKRRRFDYCIIDEGSQALPPVVFGALAHAHRFIVFGDPNQLPATIKSKEVKSMKIEDNIFSMFPEPEFSINLTIQYRMCQYIMKLANELLYGNQMKCGSDQQAVDYLSLSAEATKQYLLTEVKHNNERKWLCLAASKKFERSVLFFDTADIPAYEEAVSASVQNEKEKDITLSIVKMLVNCGLSTDDIGIIAPYRAQVNLLRESLKQAVTEDIEVNTVDQYQGREKKVIIVSLTKSQIDGEKSFNNENGILNDVRRLNVAITRARLKVILIGNRRTLLTYPACKRLLELLGDLQQYKFNVDDFSSNFFTPEELSLLNKRVHL